MRSTAIFALAAASSIAYAEKSAESFKIVKNVLDNDVNSDFKASASGSFKASGALGAGFVPVAVVKDESSPSVRTKNGKISARDVLDNEVKASAEGSFKAAGALGVGLVPVAVAGTKEAKPFVSNKKGSKMSARDVLDNDIKASAEGSFEASGALGVGLVPVAVAGTKEAKPFVSNKKGSKISARDVLDHEFEASGSAAFKASGALGASFVPLAVVEDDDSPSINSKTGAINAREVVEHEFKAAGAASLRGALGASFLPVGVVGEKEDSPSINTKTGKINARAATQQVYGQCGGGKYSGPTECASGSKCYTRDASYSQCLPLVQQAYGQCAGNSYFGTNVCAQGSSCKKLRSDYSQCIPDGGKSTAKAVAAPEDGADMEEMTRDEDPKHTAEGEDVDPVHASMSAEMYKTEEVSAPAYTSAATQETAPASYMTEDTMMAMPTASASMEKESSMMESSMMMAKPTESSMMMLTTSTSAMAMPTAAYGTANGTKTAGSASPSGTGMNKPVYEGAASGLMVPGMVLGAGMAALFGLLM